MTVEEEGEWAGIEEEVQEYDDEGDPAEFDVVEGEVPLQWDELFAQAVGEAEDDTVEQDDEMIDDVEFEDDEDDVDVVLDSPGPTPLPKVDSKGKKRGKPCSSLPMSSVN